MRSSTTYAEDQSPARHHEALGIAAFAGAALLALSLGSYDRHGGDDWCGPVGASVAGTLLAAFGVGALWLPIEAAIGAVALLGLRPRGGWATHAACLLGMLILGCPLLHLALGEVQVFGGMLAGGVLGEVIAEVLRALVGPAGAYVVCIAALLATLVLRTRISVVAVSRRFGGWGVGTLLGAYRSTREGMGALAEAWREAKALEEEERARAEAEASPRIMSTIPGELDAATTAAEQAQEDALDETLDDDADEAVAGEEADDDLSDEADAAQAASARQGGSGKATKRTRGKAASGPRIVRPRSEAGQRRAPVQASPQMEGPFMLPPTKLLAEPSHASLQIDEASLRHNAERLVEKLAAYGVAGRVDEIHPGPVVTLYEFEPASGTKIAKIANLADDLAMALAAEKVRIVAPIPGKARVGFELPNDIRQTVFLRDLLEDPKWTRFDATLPLALGKDIKGQAVYCDLAKMPHLLVAGATGAGKSVGLNVMLSSLLMKKTPADVRLIMIDPKHVEFQVFDGIPHMLLPVVTDMKKASLALRWAVDEMERRYQLFADVGARNVAGYNAKVEKVKRGELSLEKFAPSRVGKQRAIGPSGEEVLLNPTDGEAPDDIPEPQSLPSIVLVVDEFSDLMMVAAKDVEAAIARLAQKARAAGIHVILATQRPSVDVITGMIKANFPSRIAYKVAQREDSKTILGRNGAEHLLGLGDMLALMPGTSDLKRVHSAFIGDDEVTDVCDFLRLQGDPVYDESILEPRDEEGDAGGGPASDDPLYDRAVSTVAAAGYCSISHLQRRLGVGYNKAANLVERMEEQGVVGPPSDKAGGRREVFIEAR